MKPERRRELKGLASDFRKINTLDNAFRLFWFDVLKARLRRFLEGFEIISVPDAEFPKEIYAAADSGTNKVYVRQSTLAAAMAGNGRARMTVMHEIAHLFLRHPGIYFRRVNEKNVFGRAKPLEEEAKQFAAYVLVSDEDIENCDGSIEQISKNYYISQEAAKYRKAEYDRQERRENEEKRPLNDKGFNILLDLGRRYGRNLVTLVEGDRQNRRWLEVVLEKHRRLAPLLESLIKEALVTRQVYVESVKLRTKNIEKALAKIRRNEYSDPPRQLTDLTGVRIVTHLPSDACAIRGILAEMFEIDLKNTEDKGAASDPDRFSYNAIHLVCGLVKSRHVSEFDGLHNLKFEVQIRTLCQQSHALVSRRKFYLKDDQFSREQRRELAICSAAAEKLDKDLQRLSDIADKI